MREYLQSPLYLREYITRTRYPRRRAVTHVIGHSIAPLKNTPVFELRFVLWSHTN